MAQPLMGMIQLSMHIKKIGIATRLLYPEYPVNCCFERHALFSQIRQFGGRFFEQLSHERGNTIGIAIKTIRAESLHADLIHVLVVLCIIKYERTAACVVVRFRITSHTIRPARTTEKSRLFVEFPFPEIGQRVDSNIKGQIKKFPVTCIKIICPCPGNPRYTVPVLAPYSHCTVLFDQDTQQGVLCNLWIDQAGAEERIVARIPRPGTCVAIPSHQGRLCCCEKTSLPGLDIPFNNFNGKLVSFHYLLIICLKHKTAGCASCFQFSAHN